MLNLEIKSNSSTHVKFTLWKRISRNQLYGLEKSRSPVERYIINNFIWARLGHFFGWVRKVKKSNRDVSHKINNFIWAIPGYI